MEGNQMSKIVQNLTVTAASLALSLLVLDFNPVKAATVTYDINIFPTSGPLSGSPLSGFFSFDDSALTNSGNQSLPISNFSLSFEKINYTQNDYPTASVDFFNGSLLGLNYSVDVPGFSLVSGSFTNSLQDAYFAYDLGIISQNGEGDVDYSLRTASVPEPSTVVGVVALGFGALFKRKQKPSEEES
ncbi:PEP-CTERM sorting domain-containing protein [Nostoc muscorum FACHB-395]|nr:PEP-CTERM sorting domain-containing protein [Desmonostoc muscorum FACHB-395]